MSNVDDYEVKLGVITAIKQGDVKTPSMPVDTFAQEGENLFNWAKNDKDQLVGAGLDWKLVKDVPVRCGALHEAESRWFSTRFTREEAQREWMEKSPEAYDLRDQLLHAFTYAYSKNSDIAGRVSAIRDGASHDDMIQDLNDIAVIGRQNPDPLKMINFDTAMIDKAAKTADEMAALLGKATSEDDDSQAKKIRDQAYTHLKEAVDEIRGCGQYVFWRDEERMRGYGSEYLRRIRKAHERRKKEGIVDDTPLTE